MSSVVEHRHRQNMWTRYSASAKAGDTELARTKIAEIEKFFEDSNLRFDGKADFMKIKKDFEYQLVDRTTEKPVLYLGGTISRTRSLKTRDSNKNPMILADYKETPHVYIIHVIRQDMSERYNGIGKKLIQYVAAQAVLNGLILVFAAVGSRGRKFGNLVKYYNSLGANRVPQHKDINVYANPNSAIDYATLNPAQLLKEKSALSAVEVSVNADVKANGGAGSAGAGSARKTGGRRTRRNKMHRKTLKNNLFF
jgi:hypothetical protein